MQRIVVVVVAQLQLPLLSFSLLFMLILSSFLHWPFVGGGFHFWLANAAYGFNEANTKLLKLDLHASLYSPPSFSIYLALHIPGLVLRPAEIWLAVITH